MIRPRRAPPSSPDIPREEARDDVRRRFDAYAAGDATKPLFLAGDACHILARLPEHSIACCMTSPPYWGQRQYAGGGLGAERRVEEYLDNLLAIFAEVARVLAPSGSLWLNIGDRYRDKRLMGIPWRLALALVDTQGWVLRNEVIWNKVKGGPDQSRDKLRNVHEPLFHLVRRTRGYHYDVEAIRSAPRQAKVIDGAVVSATGVSGVRYRRQIELSTALSATEKRNAVAALSAILAEVRDGALSDFRMIIRGQQRTTHSNSRSVSGRARELAEKGFYFLRYHPSGSKPGDVWDIMPEDSHRRGAHYAPYPEDLCRMPLLATCPADGIVLDPFCGTGTTMRVAQQQGKKSVGVDIAEDYLRSAEERCGELL